MKNKIFFLLTVCVCGCMSMFGQTGNIASTGCDSLPTPQWEEGYATITGKTINYDATKDDNPNDQIYPRSSFGRYIDKKHGTAPVDSAGIMYLE